MHKRISCNHNMVKLNDLYKTIQTEIEINKDNLESILKPHIEKIQIDVKSTILKLDTIVEDIIKFAPLKMTMNELYYYMSDFCAERIGNHHDYNLLASRLCVERLHKCTPDHIKDVIKIVYNNHDINGDQFPLVSDELFRIVEAHASKIQKEIDLSRDYTFDYFGIRTLERSYLLRIHNSKAKTYYKEDKKGQIIERPQHMWMRVAIGIHGDDLKSAFETYHLLSQKYFTHATPTLFNAGTEKPQLSSCFVEDTEVFTLNDGIKKIQNVKIGDEVVTHTGKSQKVVQIHMNKLNGRKIMKLNVAKTKKILVTENHKFLSLDENKEPAWIPVSELKTGSRIAIPNYDGEEKKYVIDVSTYLKNIDKNKTKLEYHYENNYVYSTTSFSHSNLSNVKIPVQVKKRSLNLNRKWEVNKEFAEFIGMYLGDGNLMTHNGIAAGIALSVHNINKNEIKRIEKLGKNIFGIEPTIRKINNQNVIQIQFHSNILGFVMEKIFGKGFAGKKLPNFMFKLPTDIIYSLMAGLITTDGCILKDTVITLRMSNKNIINQIYHLCRNRGIDVSFQQKKIMPKLASTIPFILNIPKIKEILERTNKYYEDDRLKNCYKKMKTHSKNQSSPIIINKMKYLRIESVEETDLTPEYVYTLGVENDHSYNVEGLICENCFLLGAEDSLDSILNSISKIGKISKWAGGIGIHLSAIRSKGSLIRGTNGLSDGIIKLCKVLNQLGLYINQGGKRNGSIACYVELWHADIFDFCELRKNTGDEGNRARDLFLALWVPDLFMKRVESDGLWSLMCPDESINLCTTHGDEFERLYIKYEKEGKFKRQVKARELYFHIMDCQIETGMPYFLFKDNANKKSNQKNLGTIRSSNLCVAGDTYILTKTGQYKIKELVDKKVNVWNGKEWSPTTIRQTGSNKELIRIELSNGVHIDCTPEHKFYKQVEYNDKYIKIQASELKTNDKLIKWDLPNEIKNIEQKEFKFPYTHGFFCGDGTTTKNYSKTLDYPRLTLYGEKKLLKQYIDHESCGSGDTKNNILNLTLPKQINKKFDVPINYDINTIIRWLEGYLDADGCITSNDSNQSVQASSIHKDFLLEIRLMLQTIGIESKVVLCKNERTELLPDGKGSTSLYNCKTLWRILISSNGLYKLSKLGFMPKRLKFIERKPQRNAESYVKVLSVTKLDERQNTYCFTEPKRNMGMFNGILTGNCAEIIQYSDGNETSVCNLASICLPSFIEYDEKTEEPTYNFTKLQQVSKVCVKNLNKIIDKNFYPTPETAISNDTNRPIGIGVQGLADVYNIFKYPFGSDEARKLNKQIFETIYFAGLTESYQLSKEFGKYKTFNGSPFSQGLLQWHLWGLKESDLLMGFDWKKLIDNIKKFGTRNSLITALMPTASTSQIMGNYEAFEPYMSNIFVRSTLAGEYIVINKHLMKDLLKLNLWNDDMRKKILVNNGSIQSISEIPDNLKEVYKTSFELRQKDIIIQASERGPFIDQSQSMNLFMDKPSYDVLHSCHMTSWKRGLKTGMYYLRSKPAVDPIQFGVEDSEIKELKKDTSKNSTTQGTINLSNINFTSSRNVQVIECLNCSS